MNNRPRRKVPAMEALEELLMLSCSITWDEVDQVSLTRTRVTKTGNLVVAVESWTTVCGLGRLALGEVSKSRLIAGNRTRVRGGICRAIDGR